MGWRDGQQLRRCHWRGGAVTWAAVVVRIHLKARKAAVDEAEEMARVVESPTVARFSVHRRSVPSPERRRREQVDIRS